jgi:hypothetical protein
LSNASVDGYECQVTAVSRYHIFESIRCDAILALR